MIMIFRKEYQIYLLSPSLDSPQLIKLLEDCSAEKNDVIFTDLVLSFANTLSASLEIVQQLYDIGVMIYFNREDYLSDNMAFTVLR